MTTNHPAVDDDGREIPENQSSVNSSNKVLGKLYRLKEVIAGLISLAEDGGISLGQVKDALRKTLQKTFKD